MRRSVFVPDLVTPTPCVYLLSCFFHTASATYWEIYAGARCSFRYCNLQYMCSEGAISCDIALVIIYKLLRLCAMTLISTISFHSSKLIFMFAE
ncbi:hypothetical protein PENSPDRAFT_478037 [Peniophora sp. CONT]|nr:hypothetical protein PENSPDRAFT_478037 [Peniophora sp. CONT]